MMIISESNPGTAPYTKFRTLPFGIQRIGFVTEKIGLVRSAIISAPVSIDFDLKKHFSVAKRIVFAGGKIFFVVQKVRFVAEML